MRKAVLVGAVAVLVAGGAFAAPSPAPRRPAEGTLKVGDIAPDFTVTDVEGKTTVKLSGLKGKPVVLLFGSCT